MAETTPLDKKGRGKRGKAEANKQSGLTTADRPYFGTLQVRQPDVITRTGPLGLTRKAAKRPALLSILLYGSLLELLYLLIVTLASLPPLHLSSTPLATAWSWTLLPSQVLFAGAWSSAHNAATQHWPYTLLLSAALVALTGVYAFAVWRVLRMRSLDSSYSKGYWLPVLMGGVLLFGLTLLLQPVLFSDDVFTYIFSGRILTIYHADPLNTHLYSFPRTPICAG